MCNQTTPQAQATEDDDCCPDGCDMRVCDDSYDDHFGTVRIPPYFQCNVCNRTESMPERHQ